MMRWKTWIRAFVSQDPCAFCYNAGTDCVESFVLTLDYVYNVKKKNLK